jgi:hypothetical protein
VWLGYLIRLMRPLLRSNAYSSTLTGIPADESQKGPLELNQDPRLLRLKLHPAALAMGKDDGQCRSLINLRLNPQFSAAPASGSVC